MKQVRRCPDRPKTLVLRSEALQRNKFQVVSVDMSSRASRASKLQVSTPSISMKIVGRLTYDEFREVAAFAEPDDATPVKFCPLLLHRPRCDRNRPPSQSRRAAKRVSENFRSDLSFPRSPY